MREFMIYRVGKYGKYLSCAKCGTNKRMAELAGTSPPCGDAAPPTSTVNVNVNVNVTLTLTLTVNR